MEAHRRIQQLSLRRKEKLKQILESQLSPDVSLKQKLLIINQALINVDDLFDQGMSFSQVIQELRFRIDRELSTTARKIESDSKLSHHQQQFQTLNNQRRNYNDQYNVNKSSANIQRTENQNYNSFISAKNINHGSEKSLSEWDEYDEIRSRFDQESRDVNKNFEEIQRKIVPAVSPFEYKAKQDELKALEIMKLGQAYYREKEISDKVHLKQTLQENRDALLRQMKERQDLISKEQEQDKIYGLSLAERKRRAEMHEIQDRLRSKEKQKDYHIALKSQIEVKLSERQQFDRIKEEFKKLNISSQDISQKSPYPMIKEPRSKFSPNYRAASENKYGQPMNYSLPSERNVTPGRDKFLAHYGSNILHN